MEPLTPTGATRHVRKTHPGLRFCLLRHGEIDEAFTMGAPRYAIIDCETTGFGPRDRIIEIGVVVLDGARLDVVDEFDSLVNPMRDVGRSDIHGIRPSMLGAAPTFEELVGGLASRLDNAVLVAHNLPFDARFLTQECALAGVDFAAGKGICTLGLSGEKLACAAARYGIPLGGHHRALADARATAALLRVLFDASAKGVAARMRAARRETVVRTLRREAVDASSSTGLARLLARACYPSSLDACISYFELLDWALADGSVSDEEQIILDSEIRQLGLSTAQIQGMHESYLASIVQAAQRDGVVTTDEHLLLSTVCRSLGLSEHVLPSISSPPSAQPRSELKPGTRICFTGAACDPKGEPIVREDLESMAARLGCQPVAGVSKRSCDLLVAADPTSMSGKSMKARQYGLPIMGVDEFLRLVRCAQ
jgi:DNA polymerase-3 subunit epsilon